MTIQIKIESKYNPPGFVCELGTGIEIPVICLFTV